MSSLKSQMKSRFKGMYHHKMSKHDASEFEKKAYIFSKSTRDNYIRAGEHFINYIKTNNLKAATIAEAEKYVPMYLNYKIDNNYSAWTIKQEASALGKLYQKETYNEFGVELPTRHRADIVRGRTESDYNKHFSETRNEELVSFARSCGLRRNELLHLKGSDIYKDDRNNIIIKVNGTYAKGGRERTVKLYSADPQALASARATAEKYIGSNEKLFSHISKAADIHSYRAEYAQGIYNSVARDVDTLKSKELYQCRNEQSDKKFDREAVVLTTYALGHSRCNVCVNNYLVR